MELKKYQSKVLNDLAEYIDILREEKNLNKAYRTFWDRRNISVDNTDGYLHPYDNSIVGVPRVTVKVPTAGGKTFIACNAIRTIFDKLPSVKSKVVAWFVPSDTILKQTYENLSNPNHPYRQRIDSLFNGAVRVIDKETALSGTGINPVEVKEQLTIFVLSIQSFASKTKDGKRVYRENENLTEYCKHFDSTTKMVDNADETAFIQVLSYLNPVVVIDESHNFEANLRVEVLNDINPRFILDLTATPRKKSNIISFVDARKLKEANMVKLPVIVYNHRSKDDVISKAICLQKSLEQKAMEQESKGGCYIRPIVLFQAQPNTDSDSETFERIKEKLIQIGIPEEQIKIKTAQKNEIKKMDLMSRECPVRYIITVNALKEGWDCPFAYILASLANRTSKVDVEQILGRVLRLPYTTKHKNNLLNLSYVFTSSDNFNETIREIISGLNRAGYSKRDAVLPEQEEKKTENKETVDYGGLFGEIEENHTPNILDEQNSETIYGDCNNIDNLEDFNVENIKQTITNQDTDAVEEIERIAIESNNRYEEEIKEANANNDNIPNDLKDMQKYHGIKEHLEELAKNIELPKFVKKVASSSIFDEDNETSVEVTKKMLAEGFELCKCDKNISFTRTSAQAQKIDLSAGDEFTPKAFDINDTELQEFRKYFRTLPHKSKLSSLASKIARALKYDEIVESHIKEYVSDVIKDFDEEQLGELYDHELTTQTVVKKHIDNLLVEYKRKRFKGLLDVSTINCEPKYKFPTKITFRKIAIGLSKGLYTEEDGDINEFEYSVIKDISNLENVVFWHRNPERGKEGFCINGFINHYPDFIIGLRSGRIILVETKGDDRDNSDSRRKIELGTLWANKAGDNYRYYMVFNSSRLEGAITVQELIERLKNL